MITKEDRIFITGGSGFIGTNLIDLFMKKGYDFINLDKAEPIKKDQISYWVKGNIVNMADLESVFSKYHPTLVIHLAARTDTLSTDIKDYSENTQGSKNIIDIVKKYSCVRHLIMTSTQYVYKSLTIPFPSKDDEYIPHTTYGLSKKIMEEDTRHSNLQCAWTIVRPANVWGPWHMRYPNELWKVLDKGFYVHPTKQPAVRTYAYVKNLTHQIDGIINADLNIVNEQTYYLGDLPIDSRLWLEEWVKQLRGSKLHYIPTWIMRGVAIWGDVLGTLGIKFPIYSIRFNNMMEDWYDTTNKTIDLFGVRNENLSDNVKETIEWLKGEGVSFFPYWKKKYGKN